jgi:hypothetical protein
MIYFFILLEENSKLENCRKAEEVCLGAWNLGKVIQFRLSSPHLTLCLSNLS